jgi:mercuric ion transport protein
MVRCLVHQYSYRILVKPQGAVVASIKWSDKPYLRWLTLFVASGTLVCCVLPIVLVSLGFGAVVAGLFYNIPSLVFLAEHKMWTLSLSALLLGFLAWMIWSPNQQCPADAQLAEHCQQAKRWNKRIFWLSISAWSIGFFFSVLLLPLRQLLDM